MKLFYSYMWCLFAHIPTLSKVVQISLKIFSPANQWHSLVILGRCFFLVFCFTVFSKVHAQSVVERADAGQRLKKIERKSIPYFVKIENKDRIRGQVLHFNPDADLNKYPLFEYSAYKERITPIKLNSRVPDEILDLSIRIVNDRNGRDSITLRELSKDKILVLDFWATWCSPCLESMDKWKQLQPKYAEQVQVVGLMLDYDYKAELSISKKGWDMPQIIGPEVYLLNTYFCKTPMTGPSAWINKGKFIGVTETRVDSERLINRLLSGEIVAIPEEAMLKLEVN